MTSKDPINRNRRGSRRTADRVLAAGESSVARARSTYSRQPRFRARTQDMFGAIYYWLKHVELEQRPYQAHSMARDLWLRDTWKLEPHWQGVLNSICLIDSNRGWTLTGGRNQVYRYTAMLHDAEEGQGWRTFVKLLGLSYHTSDLGAVAELGREGQGGPLRGLYHVDPCRCRLTGDVTAPLEYTPYGTGSPQRWVPGDFIRLASMPSNDEAMRGLGFCSTSRAIEVLKILYGVLLYDQEQLGARMPQGLLLLQGIGEEQWRQALAARKEDLAAEDRARFGGVMVLAGSGAEDVDAKLVGLSNLPAGFDRETFVNQAMYAYALVTGYDAREFWPGSSGQLGTATETETQHLKATGKGGLDFVLSLQERLQRELPDSIQFEFEQRDDAGALLEATVAQAWADVAKTLYEAGMQSGFPLLDRQYALSLLADHGIIPPEWTEIEEDSQATDTEAQRSRRERQKLLERPEIRRAAEMFPDEPIVRYRWPAGRLTTLWERGADALSPRAWSVMRQEDEVLYQDPDGDFSITGADVDRAIAEARRRLGNEYAELLTAEPLTEADEAALENVPWGEEV